MFLRRVAFILCWLVLALYVLRNPTQAATTVKTIATGLASLADAVAAFAAAL
ncbi:hypothetical protein [Actinomadura flavalba]|uniref:hypothetical protein n=1 Tax=Actinomadura flavalba TaxID=1120938 RepID=UPI00037C81BE|nr:hypothetical protein [Actinomadura flavalba]